MPSDLKSRIKVRPPVGKHFTSHNHRVDEPWLRLENQKNYSPLSAIKKSESKEKERDAKIFVNNDSNHSQEKEEAEEPPKLFRDRLVEFLVEQQNSKSDSNTLSQLNTFDADPKTLRVINRMLSRQQAKKRHDDIYGKDDYTIDNQEEYDHTSGGSIQNIQKDEGSQNKQSAHDVDFAQDQRSLESAFFDYFESLIKKCSVSSLQQEWVVNILSAIPKKLLRVYPKEVEILMEEVKGEFRESGRDCAVSHVLKRPQKSQREVWNDKVQRQESAAYFEQRLEDYSINRGKLEKLLFIGHPLMRQVLELWTHFHSTRIIDIAKIKAQKESYRIFSFRSSIMVQAEKCRSKLWNEWLEAVLKTCTDVLLKKQRGRKITVNPGALKSLETLISIQVVSLTNASLDEYYSLFTVDPLPYHLLYSDDGYLLALSKISETKDITKTQVDTASMIDTLDNSQAKISTSNNKAPQTKDKNPPRFSIVLNYIKKQKSIEFDPPLADIEEAVIECLSLIVSTLSTLPDFEKIISKELNALTVHLLGSDMDRKDIEVPMILLTDSEQIKMHAETLKIATMTAHLKKYSGKCFEMATDFLQRYQKYIHLFSSGVKEEIVTFLADEHTFEEHAAEITKYQSIGKELFELPRRVELIMLDLQMDELHRVFIAQAQLLASRFINKLIAANIAEQKG